MKRPEALQKPQYKPTALFLFYFSIFAYVPSIQDRCFSTSLQPYQLFHENRCV